MIVSPHTLLHRFAFASRLFARSVASARSGPEFKRTFGIGTGIAVAALALTPLAWGGTVKYSPTYITLSGNMPFDTTTPPYVGASMLNGVVLPGNEYVLQISSPAISLPAGNYTVGLTKATVKNAAGQPAVPPQLQSPSGVNTALGFLTFVGTVTNLGTPSAPIYTSLVPFANPAVPTIAFTGTSQIQYVLVDLTVPAGFYAGNYGYQISTSWPAGVNVTPSFTTINSVVSTPGVTVAFDPNQPTNFTIPSTSTSTPVVYTFNGSASAGGIVQTASAMVNDVHSNSAAMYTGLTGIQSNQSQSVLPASSAAALPLILIGVPTGFGEPIVIPSGSTTVAVPYTITANTSGGTGGYTTVTSASATLTTGNGSIGSGFSGVFSNLGTAVAADNGTVTLGPGTYTITATDTNGAPAAGGGTASATETVTFTVVSASAQINAQSGTLTDSHGNTYPMSMTTVGAGSASSITGTVSATLPAGSYTLTLGDLNQFGSNAAASMTFTVVQLPPPSLPTVQVTKPVNDQTSGSVVAIIPGDQTTAPVTYYYQGGSLFGAILSQSATLTGPSGPISLNPGIVLTLLTMAINGGETLNLPAGLYTLTATDRNPAGPASDTVSFQVVQSAAPTIAVGSPTSSPPPGKTYPYEIPAGSTTMAVPYSITGGIQTVGTTTNVNTSLISASAILKNGTRTTGTVNTTIPQSAFTFGTTNYTNDSTQAASSFPALGPGLYTLVAQDSNSSTAGDGGGTATAVVQFPVWQQQAITFPQPANVIYGSGPFALGAYSTIATLPITYTVVSGPAVVSPAGIVSITGAGTVVLQADQPGNPSQYIEPAPSVQTSFTVIPAALTVTANNQQKNYDGTAFSPFTATYSGFVNGESAASLGGTLGFSGTAAGAANAGTYAITPGGLTSRNYAITYLNGTLTINKAALTVTADNKSKGYGAPVPALTYTITGFVNGESASTVAIAGTPSLSTTAQQSSPVIAGGYPISISGSLSAANYTFTYVNGNLTVTPAPITITAGNATKVYGTANPTTLTGSLTSGTLFNGDLLSSVSTFGLSSSITTSTGVGTYAGAVTATPVSTNLNYQITVVPGTFTVTPATLTITANNQTKQYGTALNLDGITPQTAGFTPTGLVTGDKVTSVTLASPGSVATAGVAGSPYPIAPNAALGTGLGNYSIVYVNGTLTVTPAPITITASNASKVYGAPVPTAFTGTVTSGTLLNGDLLSSVCTFGVSPSITASTAVGTYPGAVTATSAGNLNYAVTVVPGTFTVTQATLTITAKDQTKSYGTALNLGTTLFTTSGLLPGDQVASVTLTSAGSVATAGVAGSTYAIIPSAASGTGLGNYAIGYVNGKLTVTPAAITVTASPASKVYGAANPTTLTGTLTSGSLVNGDSLSSVCTFALSPSITTSTGAGSYPGAVIAAAVSTNLNYTVTVVPATLTVTKAVLTVTADNKSIIAGAAIPALTYTITGFVNGDLASVVSGTPSLATTATASSPAGTYPITITPNTLSAANYLFNCVPGTLSIGQVKPQSGPECLTWLNSCATSSGSGSGDHSSNDGHSSGDNSSNSSSSGDHSSGDGSSGDHSSSDHSSGDGSGSGGNCGTSTSSQTATGGSVVPIMFALHTCSTSSGSGDGTHSGDDNGKGDDIHNNGNDVSHSNNGSGGSSSTGTGGTSSGDHGAGDDKSGTDKSGGNDKSTSSGSGGSCSCCSSGAFVADTSATIAIYEVYSDNTSSTPVIYAYSATGPNPPYFTIGTDAYLLNFPTAAGTHHYIVEVYQTTGSTVSLLGSEDIYTQNSCMPAKSDNGSNFNGTAIAAGNTIWFNSVVNVRGLSSVAGTLVFDNSVITFSLNGKTVTLPVPSATIKFDAKATSASTVFSTITNSWVTTVPVGYKGNVFLSGLAYTVPANFPKGLNPVTWTGTFRSDTSAITAQWQWAAAVYTKFSGTLSACGVKPVDDNKLSSYQNSDHAGSPEGCKSSVTGGARGGGGSDCTGSYSGTISPSVGSSYWMSLGCGADDDGDDSGDHHADGGGDHTSGGHS